MEASESVIRHIKRLRHCSEFNVTGSDREIFKPLTRMIGKPNSRLGGYLKV